MKTFIAPLRGVQPTIGKSCFLAENAVIIGDVEIGDYSSVWYSAVVRGDVNFIRVGHHTNIQDNVTVHGTYQDSPTYIGNYVTIGHNAVIHACKIKDNVLVGMGAVVLDDAVLNEGTLVAAGAVVTVGTVTEKNSLYAGIPAKKVKDLTDNEVQKMITRNAEKYVMYTAEWYLKR